MEENNTKQFIITECAFLDGELLSDVRGLFNTEKEAQDRIVELAIAYENILNAFYLNVDYYGEWTETGEWRYQNPVCYILLSIEEVATC